jgi:hypothetical protein
MADPASALLQDTGDLSKYYIVSAVVQMIAPVSAQLFGIDPARDTNSRQPLAVRCAEPAKISKIFNRLVSSITFVVALPPHVQPENIIETRGTLTRRTENANETPTAFFRRLLDHVALPLGLILPMAASFSAMGEAQLTSAPAAIATLRPPSPLARQESDCGTLALTAPDRKKC